MWFGTDNGLSRFDGTRFRTYDMKDGIPDKEVVGLFEDSSGRMWISCFGKQPSFIKNGKIFNVNNDSLLAKVKRAGVYSFYEDKKGRIWLASGRDEYYCLSNTECTEYKSSYTIHNFGEFGQELYIFSFFFIDKFIDKKTPKQCFITPPPFLQVSKEAIQYMLDGKKNSPAQDVEFFRNNRSVSMAIGGDYVMYAYLEGLLLVKYADGNFIEVGRLPGVHCTSVFYAQNGQFWAKLIDGGVVNFNIEIDGLSKPHYYLLDKKVSSAYIDENNNVWFSTLNDGIYMLPTSAVLNYNSTSANLFSDNITAICQLKNGDLVIGDDNGNVYKRQGKAFQLIKKSPLDGTNKIRRIIATSDNGWMAVTDKAFYTNDDRSLPVTRAIGALKSLCISNNNIWIGTSSFLIKTNMSLSSTEFILNDRVMTVNGDHEQNLWIGGLTGLFSEKDSFQYNWGNKFRPLSSRIIDIQHSKPNIIWVATPDYGLIKAKVGKGEILSIEVINDKLASPIESIKSIYPEHDGEVWLSTNKGVFLVDKEGKITNYNQTNGIISNDVNSTLVEQDTLWAATVSGLSKLLLKQQGETGDFHTLIPSVSYLIGNQKQQLDLSNTGSTNPRIKLPVGATMLEVDLAALQYRTRGNLHYEYSSLEELLPLHLLTFENIINCIFKNKVQKSVVDGASQNYGANLSPRKLLVQATAILPYGTRSLHPAQITIIVTPCWWQTIWFSLSLVILASYGIWRVIKARSNYLKLQSTASELQLQAIKSQMNPHFVGNSINAIQQFFYPPDPVKASEYISIFSDLLRRTMTFSEIDFIPFQEEIRYMKDYLQMVKLRFGEQFNYEIIGEDKIEPTTKFPAMLLQPILENATIHGLSPDHPSELTVSFDVRDGHVYCTLTDNGVGINESLRRKSLRPIQRPSKGLQLLEQKAQMINKIHHVDLKLSTTDRQQIDPSSTGTQIIISFLKKTEPSNEK